MVDDTSSGVKESTMEKPATAASSTLSLVSEKRNTKKTEKPITQGEALQLLASALNYCQKSGLSVTGYNRTGGLVLFIENVFHTGKTIVVTPANESNDTAKEEVTT